MRSQTERFGVAGQIRTLEPIGFTIAVTVIAGILTACGRDAALTGPSPQQPPTTVAAPPPPLPETVTLSGRVTESLPNTMTGLWDARVTLSDGTRSWASPLTVGGEGLGRYTISGLSPGRFDATVSANGYVSVSRQLTLNSDTTTDFPLLPVPETKTFTFTGQITDTDGTCSDGVQTKPCRICVLPIHNAGPFEATLTWTAASAAAVTVTLFQNGQQIPIARSTAVDATTQRLTADLPGLALYELHVLYISGTDPVSYTMPVMYQN